MLSARNQLPAVVKSVKLGNVMAKVVMEVAGVVDRLGYYAAECARASPGDQGRHQGDRSDHR